MGTLRERNARGRSNSVKSTRGHAGGGIVIRLILGLAAVFLFSVCQTAFAWSPEDMLATASYPTHSCLQSFYVSTTGQDDNSGASEAEPLRTITRAASMASPGDCVVVMPGIYQERVVISHGGNADSSTGY